MPRRGRWFDMLVWAGLALAAVVAFRAAAAVLYRAGFPLDDAWIHQTYARNLAQGVGWMYRASGLGRGAVTAPLWVLILAVGHGLGVPPGLWVSLLGWGGLVALAGVAVRGWGGPGGWRWAAALAVLLEWHLVWAAVSGMETLAFTLAGLVSVTALLGPQPLWGTAGLAAGVALWLRPEGVLLVPLLLLRVVELRIGNGGESAAALHTSAGTHLPTPAGRGAASLRPAPAAAAPHAARPPHPYERYERKGVREGAAPLVARPARGALRALLVVLLWAGAYLLFHRVVTGGWWPTTGPAKMTEYAALRAQPFPGRWLRVWGPVLVGPAALAALGLLLGLFRAPRQVLRQGRWLTLIWALAHATLYAWRLPVTYQHGRYLMPVLPAVLLLGVEGWRAGLAGLAARARRLAIFALASLAGALALGFLALGARAYAWDVAFIESEMVDTARWVARNLPPDAVVAAHDIGALGYFAPQPLVDLAGLLDPRVIPLLHNETALARYVQQAGTAYLVTFPSWYTTLDACSEPVFVTGARFAPTLGGENMVVYAWRPCP